MLIMKSAVVPSSALFMLDNGDLMHIYQQFNDWKRLLVVEVC
jgi:hypothetical protein